MDQPLTHSTIVRKEKIANTAFQNAAIDQNKKLSFGGTSAIRGMNGHVFLNWVTDLYE